MSISCMSVFTGQNTKKNTCQWTLSKAIHIPVYVQIVHCTQCTCTVSVKMVNQFLTVRAHYRLNILIRCEI